MRRKRLFFFFIILLFLTVCFFQLESLPGEWFGDVSNVHEYVSQILQGRWQFYFFQSPGPLYHYLIAPIIALLGASYTSYKIASVFIGLAGLIGTYLLAKEIVGRKIAQLTILVMSFSFWFIVWARLGNSQIIIPVLTSLTVYFAYKRNLFWGIAISSLGLFAYPQTFILPFLFIILLLFREKKRLLIIVLLSYLPALLLFGWLVSKQRDNFVQGYVGSKVFGVKGIETKDLIIRFGDYFVKTASMLHLEGDKTFRVNIPGSSHLDKIGGIFFLVGVYYVMRHKKRDLPYIFIPLFLLILPSLSVALPKAEIPSMSRTIGIIPFVYLLVACGILYSYKLFPKYILFPIIISLVYLNLQKYFILYPKVLPNQNVPYGKIMAEYIDTLPQNIEVHLTSCCWGQSGQPEPKAIYYVLKNKNKRENIVHEKFLTSCREVDKKEGVLLIFNPKEVDKIEEFRQCFAGGEFKVHNKDNQDIFASLYLTN